MHDRPASFGLDRCNCAALRRAARRITQLYDEKLAPAHLRITQYAILALVAGIGPLPVKDLAERLELDRTTTGKNLRPLERAGLIKTVPSATDGRSRMVTLTAKGSAAFARAVPLWQAAQREFETANGTAPSAALRATLTQLKAGARSPG